MPPASDNLADSLILCATSRLAQSLRWQHDRARVAAGETNWPTLNTSTVAQWLARISEAALLRGESDPLLSRRLLDAFQEQLLWERVIADTIPGYAASFFDVPGMAATAAEANALMVVWGVVANAGDSEETQAFLRWRRKFNERCNEQGWIDPARLNEAVLALIERNAARLPQEVFFAGFDNITPQETRLKQILVQQGVQVSEWPFAGSAPQALSVRMLADPDSERRAVACWAATQLERNPAVRLGIVVPNLGVARDGLETALDDMLHPSLQRPSRAEAQRCYNFSLGKPLPQQPLVAVALDLIEFATGSGEVEQGRIGELLRNPYWSAGVSEADARARLEVALREHLGATTTLARVLSFAQRFDKRDEAEQARAARLSMLFSHLAAIETTRREWRKNALPSQWAERFRQLLRHAGWPGERSLSSHEFQAREAFAEELARLAALDDILGTIAAREAQRRLVQLCNAHVFQAETAGDPQIQVVGMLEAGGMRFDALWVMGMTDDAWPPPPRPDPLLPAEQQRKVNAPNSSAQAQLAFAKSIHGRLLQSASEITFSFAHADGVTELRPSPLLAPYLDFVRAEPVEARAPFDELSVNGESEQRWAAPIDDSIAPPVAEGEHVAGGTGLLRAQAICPAWAYYRYRLGAKKLQTPVEGLDAAARGSIVHDALRAFWQVTGSLSVLRAMSDAERDAAIDKAACAALDGYDHEHRTDPLPPIFRKLEHERLQRLLANWLAVELQREQPFSIISCEERFEVDIDGIVCKLQIDRIDRLDDGREIVIDYKTGAVAGTSAWAAARITDPQLPVYAAIARPDQPPAVVAFGRVLFEDARFLGIAAEEGLLPRVPGIDSGDARRVFSADEFADWQAVLQHWRTNVAAMAREVKAGVAAVRVENEADLRYCDVLPLLRLAERRAQWEAEK